MWWYALRKLDGGDTERPNIRFVVVLGLLNHFGGHPEWRADDRLSL